MTDQESHSVGIYTLGCKVNQYESEAIAEAFENAGFTVSEPTLPCDFYVVNTCTVTAESDRKARQFIRRAIRSNPDAHILVTGCYSQTQPNEVAKIDGVDYICGNAEKLSVVDTAKKILEDALRESEKIKTPSPDFFGFEKMQIQRFDRTRAYVKIEDGCESHCTYCIIPKARGRIRSKAKEDVISEVRHLTEGGCQEVVLTGIETASYGKDTGGTNLSELLISLQSIPHIGRVRLGSLDPSIMTKAFVQSIAGLPYLAPHFHLSLQSGSDRILALMKRKYNRQMALDGIERIRCAMPCAQFTTDVIVGFPGETDADFEETLRFAEQAKFLRIHIFPYSRRKGTEADLMKDQIPESVKHERLARLSALEQTIRKEILDSFSGKRVSVLFETDENGISRGHTENFIEVACNSQIPLRGKILSVEILENNGEECFGIPLFQKS